jgi:hypothetical protein
LEKRESRKDLRVDGGYQDSTDVPVAASAEIFPVGLDLRRVNPGVAMLDA